jgi:hypothetical protein
LQKIIAALRERLPGVKILVRADSGVLREVIMRRGGFKRCGRSRI